MKKFPNLVLAALFVLGMSLGAIQGRNLSQTRDSEAFYRWIINAATQVQLGNELEPADVAAPDRELYQDRELFDAVADRLEGEFPEPAVIDEPVADAEPMSQLARLVPEGDQDQVLWGFVTGEELADLRTDFLTLRRERKLATLGTQLSAADLYSDDAALYSNVNLGNLFFGFRKVAANFVWLQVDKFWHAGQVHRMIPSMRTTVALDPSFVEAYLLGAWHMAYNVTAQLPVTPPDALEWDPVHEDFVGPRESYYYIAADFLLDGTYKNPREHRLFFDLGYAVYYQKLARYDRAVTYLARAVRLPHDRWVPRMLNMALEKNDQYADAIAGWERYAEQYPDNISAPRRIEINKGLLFEQNAERLRARASEIESDNETEAKRLRAQAEDEEKKARAVWEELNFGGVDPFAKARLLYMDAKKLHAEKRYIEAVLKLEEARMLSAEHFDKFSDYIIDIKLEGGYPPLTLSEKLALDRRKAMEDLKVRTREMREAENAE